MRIVCITIAALCGAACSQPNGLDEQTRELTAFVDGNRQGQGTDHWLELKNLSGEWEKVSLVFGFAGGGDYEECVKIAEGLRKENFAREYRCVPANQNSHRD